MATQVNPLFDRSFTCPICTTPFTSKSIRGSAVRVKTRETDFHMIYDALSPLHYSISVCPTCNYAAAVTSFNENIKPQIAEQIALALRTLKREEPAFGQERDLSTALRAFQLGIQSAQLRKASAGQLAGMLLGIAWLGREMGNGELENAYITEAIKQYEISYVKDKLPVGSLDEVTMAYLIGELYRRTGKYQQAINWFGRALSANKGSIGPAVEKMIRDQWSQARSDAANAPEGSSADTNADANESPAAATVDTPVAASGIKNEAPTVKRNRPKVTLNAHIYQDQVEWLSKIVNIAYNQSSKLSKDDVIRALIDSFKETLSLDDLKDMKISNEQELTERLASFLNKN